MINFENGAEFDPGIGNLVYSFYEIAQITENELAKIKSFHSKKSKYQFLYPKLYTILENNIFFYKGCLMWALYISNAFKETNKELLHNSFYGKEYNENSVNEEADFLSDYFNILERNSKYYYGKSSGIPAQYSQIVKTYKEFLKLNKNFTEIKTVNEIKLPNSVIEYSEEKGKEVLSFMQRAVENKNLEELREFSILK